MNIPVILYHATLKSYSLGDVVQATGSSEFYPQAVAALEQSKPAGAPSRATCLFATDNLDFCYFFALKQQWSQAQINIYEVKMDGFHKAPMAIVHALQKRIGCGQDGNKLIGEYWRPQKAWKFMEYFGQTMTISCLTAAPNIDLVALGIKYQDDFDQAVQL